MNFIGIIGAIITFASAVFILYYLPLLAIDSKKRLQAAEETNDYLRRITRQNEDIITAITKRDKHSTYK